MGEFATNFYADRRIEVMQEMSLGTNESLRIIRVDNQEFVLHVSKNGPASLHPLNSDALAHPSPNKSVLKVSCHPLIVRNLPKRRIFLPFCLKENERQIMRQLTHMSFNIFIFLCVLFLLSSVLAQGSAALIEGLPALSVSSDQDGQTTYSLSLQILAR